MRVFTLMLVIFIAVGCSTTQHVLMYSGQALPNKEISKIYADSKPHLSISRIDGEFMSTKSLMQIMSAELLPGKHAIDVTLYAGNDTFVTHDKVFYIWLDTKAGTNYIIKANLYLDDKNRWFGKAWIEEELTHKTAGGLLDYKESWELHNKLTKYISSQHEQDNEF